jgi:hypothetical protein
MRTCPRCNVPTPFATGCCEDCWTTCLANMICPPRSGPPPAPAMDPVPVANGKPCIICGKPTRQRPGRGRRRVTCSDACHQIKARAQSRLCGNRARRRGSKKPPQPVPAMFQGGPLTGRLGPVSCGSV